VSAGWEDWVGGECPVGKEMVDVQFRSGVFEHNLFGPHIRWKHWGSKGDIMAWRRTPEEDKDTRL